MTRSTMKKTFQHFLTIAAALSGSFATAQDTPPARPPLDSPPPENNRRGDGEVRRDTSDGRRGRAFDENRLQKIPATPQPYLGVATAPLDPALCAQLGFTPGLGLSVEEVIPDGPAAKAGVQALDVIKQVNDQLVSNPAHLAALARHFGKDTEVTLLVIRKGQEQKIPVKIGERVMRDPAAMRAEIFGGMPGFGRQPFERWNESPRRNNDDPNRPPRDPRDGPEGPQARPPGDVLRQIGPGGTPEVQSLQDRVSTTWSTANAKVMLKDAGGEIEVRSENGRRTLLAKNPTGETVFDGPIDTEELRKGIPPEFRKMLEQVEVRSRAERRPGGPRDDAGEGNFRRPPAEPGGPGPRRGPSDIQ